MQYHVQKILSEYSAGTIQAGYSYKMPHKVGKAPISDFEKPYRIQEKKIVVPGTRIPASTIKKFQTGQWTPREKTIKKLLTFHRLTQQHRLLAAGISRHQASMISRRKPTAENDAYIDRIISQYKKHIEFIATQKGVDPFFILWGFSQSIKRPNDWDNYIKEKYVLGLHKKPRKTYRRRATRRR